MDEYYIYNILSFDYNNITREGLSYRPDQGLEFLYDNLRKIPNPIIKGKMAEVVLHQIFCKDEEFLKLFIRVSAKLKKAGDILFKIIIVESKNWGNYNPKEILKLCRDAVYLADVASTRKKGKKAYKLEEGEITHKFCLFVHFFEDPSGKNDMKFYYIEPTDDGAEIKYSDSFDSNFKSPFLGVPFVTLNLLSDYLKSIKEYLSNMEKVIDDYNYIKILAREFELNYSQPEMRKERETLIKKIESYKKEISDLKEAHKKELSDLKEFHEKKLSELKDASRKDISNLKEIYKKEISDLKESHKKEITTITNELNSSKKDIAVLNQTIADLNQTIADMKESHNKEISTLNGKNEELTNQISALNGKNEELTNQVDSLKESNNVLTTEVATLKSIIEKLTSAIHTSKNVEDLPSN